MNNPYKNYFGEKPQDPYWICRECEVEILAQHKDEHVCQEVDLLLASKWDDPVNNPPHYTQHPSGVEVIQITEHMGFCLGNVIKYVMRADYKGKPLEDLKKARYYLNREIQLRGEK